VKPQFTITENSVGWSETTTAPWINVNLRCDWLEDVRTQLQAIESLPEGWDGNGAPPPKIKNLAAALSLLTTLCHARGLRKPHVNPTPCGGVQFEWENGSRYFEIEVVSETVATFLYRDDELGIEDEGEIFEGDDPLNGVLEYVLRVAPAIERLSTAATPATQMFFGREVVA
jgi:hypothetical protein